MASKAMIELLQSLGRLPGLSFLDQYANKIIGVKHLQRDKVDRYNELKGRVGEVQKRTGAVAGRGGSDAGAGTGTGGPGGPSGRGGSRQPGAPASGADRAALRGGPSGGNTARLRDDSAPPPPRERLRRRPDALD